jgi:acetolactate synthase-1/3 small subunit
VFDHTAGHQVERLFLFKNVRADGAARAELKRTADIFRGQIVDVSSTGYTVLLTGPSRKLDAFIRAIGKTTILEVVRSGVSGLGRGDKILSI